MYVVCTSFFGTHVVCASGLCVTTPRGFTSLPPQEAEYSFLSLIPTSEQTKPTNMLLLLLLSLDEFSSTPKLRMYLDHEENRTGNISPS